MSHSEQEFDENEKTGLSRREALKAIAVLGGTATLLTLPNKWEKPAINVGVLSAFAQCSPTCGSPSTISNLVVSDHQGSCDPVVGEDGDLFSITLLYTDPCGLMPDRSWLRVTFTFQPSGITDTDEELLGPINITDDGSGFLSGSVIVPVCIAFGNDTSVDLSVSVINGSCQPGNALAAAIANPGVTQNSQQRFTLNP